MFHSSHLPRVCRWFTAAALCVATSSLLIAQTVSSANNQGKINEQAHKSFAQLPLGFEPNRGQSDPAMQFLAHTPDANVYLTGADAVLERTRMKKDEHGSVHIEGRSAIRMHLLNATEHPTATPESLLPGKVNYLTGNDRSHWHTNVPTYSGVRLASVYPGVDLRYYGHRGTLEYDFIVAPHQSADVVRFTFDGAKPRVENNGDLVLAVQNGEPFRFGKPVAYQMLDGKRVEVPAHFQIAKNDEADFALGNYDHSRELVIDPTLVYLGTMGTGIQQVYLSQIAVDSAGALYMIGTTNDTTFPVTSSAYQKVCGPGKSPNQYCVAGGQQAAFITKLSADGTQLAYSTYLSGQMGTEEGSAITVDANGVAYLAGTTGSPDFPITSDAYQKVCDAVESDGPGTPGRPQPCAGTYFHGQGGTFYGIDNQIAFLTKLSADGSSLLYSTFLGGTSRALPDFVGLDASGNIYLTGQTYVNGTNSTGWIDFPTTSSAYMSHSTVPNSDNTATEPIPFAGFLSKLSPDGHNLLYSTLFGDNVTGSPVLPLTAAVGANGVAFIGGYTSSPNYPATPGALKTACPPSSIDTAHNLCQVVDGFVAAFDTTKSGSASLLYSTRIGGTSVYGSSESAYTEVDGLLADTNNNLFLTGYTTDSTFSVGSGGYQSVCPNNIGNIHPSTPGYIDRCDSAYLLKIDPTGRKIQEGTFFAAPYLRSPETIGRTIRMDSRGNVLVYGKGSNYGNGFPVVNPVQTDNQPPNVLFVAAFTQDLKNLLFSTLFGNPSHADHDENVVPAGLFYASSGAGMVLDTKDNIYIAGDTTDADFGTTAGTYVTAQTTGAGHHPFFAKITKVLQPTTTTLTAPSTAADGRSMTLKAIVAGVYQKTPTPTGTVTFTATSTTTSTTTTLGTASLDSSGTATTTVTVPAVDSYTVVASYGSDDNYDVSASSSATLTIINPITSSVTLASSAASINSGSTVTFTATVSASGTSLSPTGTVTFLDGTTTLGTGTLANGTATYSTSSLSAGTHSITAQYSGDSNFTSATSAAVTESVSAATISLAASPTSLTITRGQSGTVTITATPVGIYSGTVSFSCGTAITHTSCAFSPVTLTFNNGTTAQSTTLTINTNVAALSIPELPAQHRNSSEPIEAGLLATFGLLAMAGRKSARRRTRGVFLSAAFGVAMLTMGVTGCGGGSPANSTPTGSYTLPITASVSGSNVTLNLTVKVQ